MRRHQRQQRQRRQRRLRWRCTCRVEPSQAGRQPVIAAATGHLPAARATLALPAGSRVRLAADGTATAGLPRCAGALRRHTGRCAGDPAATPGHWSHVAWRRRAHTSTCRRTHVPTRPRAAAPTCPRAQQQHPRAHVRTSAGTHAPACARAHMPRRPRTAAPTCPQGHVQQPPRAHAPSSSRARVPTARPWPRAHGAHVATCSSTQAPTPPRRPRGHVPCKSWPRSLLELLLECRRASGPERRLRTRRSRAQGAVAKARRGDGRYLPRPTRTARNVDGA